MKSYHLAWAFFLKYDHQQKRLVLDLSDTFKEKHNIDLSTLMFEAENLKECIHKYDYRKLSYFSEQPLKSFDTELRFRFHQHKPYIRTHAICQAVLHGFECVLIEEKVLFETKRSLSKGYIEDIELDFLEKQDVKEHIAQASMRKMKDQLHTFFERRMI